VKIIDMHTHYVSSDYTLRLPYRKVTNRDMLMQFDDNNVSSALTMYIPELDGSDKDCMRKNKELKAALDQDRSRTYVPFAILNPLKNDREDLLELVESYGFKGLKLIPVAHNYSYDVKTCGNLLSAAEQMGVPVMLHSGWGESSSLARIDKLVSTFSDIPTIVAHMREDDTSCPRGGHIEMLKRHENVYAETSYAVHTDRIRQIVDEGLIDRVFFGDDFPFGGANVLWNTRRISDAPISREDEKKLLCGSAREFLKNYC
jgi:uncharacterized protein